jgi:Flp pilus assembly protein TadG
MSRSTYACRLRPRGRLLEGDHDRRSRSRPRGRKLPSRLGTAAVEFALVAPVFFLLVFGLLELGRMLMIQEALTNAAREGCRTAVLATTQSSSDVEAAIRGYLKPVTALASNAGKVRVTVPAGLASAAAGTDLTVAVEVNYADLSWLPFGYLGLNPTLSAKQVGKRE